MIRDLLLVLSRIHYKVWFALGVHAVEQLREKDQFFV